MSIKDTRQRKNILSGMESLMDLGGFIEEVLDEELRELYPENVITIAKKYCPSGEGICSIADVIEKDLYYYNKYLEIEYDEDGDEYLIPDPEFQEWAADQMARLTAKKFINKENNFWNSWKLTRETRKALESLNALDERILDLVCGFEKKKMTAKEISELPEFSCSEYYIERILDTIDNSMNQNKRVNEEFMKECYAHGLR